MSKELVSTHILMFPFVFTENVYKFNIALIKGDKWIYQKFNTGASVENYNEYIYFYEYVRKSLYSEQPMDTAQTSYYFEYKKQQGTYILEVNDKKYELDIEGISMRTFATGVGILSIELQNSKYNDPESVLLINDFARRLYPQFLDKERGLDGVKNVLLPQKVTLILDETIEEDFSYYNSLNQISKDATNLPSFIHKLLGDTFSSTSNDGKIHIEPIIDDRMFVISMYMNDDMMKTLKKYDEEKKQYVYESDNFWYQYIYIDAGDKMCQSRHMTKKLIADTTYDRWIEWETLFGISRYSFVAMTTEWFGQNRLKPHMHTMYFQMFSLLLAYRASMLNFSKRVSEVTVGNLELEDLQQTVTEIYKDYINFENNLFFRELTAQEQGIEIYAQALEIMQIEKHIKDLDDEIGELHTYVSMKIEEKQLKQADQRENELAHISKLGAIFLPPTVIAGILGVNTIDFVKDANSMFLSGTLIIFSALFGFATIKYKKIWKNIFIVLLTVCVVVALFFMPQKLSEHRVDTQTTHLNKKESHVKF